MNRLFERDKNETLRMPTGTVRRTTTCEIHHTCRIPVCIAFGSKGHDHWRSRWHEGCTCGPSSHVIGKSLCQHPRSPADGRARLPNPSLDPALIAAYLDCPPTSVIRRLDALAKMEIIVRRGTRYYLNEPRVNSDSAIKSHDTVRRIVLKAVGQLSETDTLES
jgi:hypothetical protein